MNKNSKEYKRRYEQVNNPWDKVKISKRGTLIGMLTDTLALNALPIQGQATQSSRMTVAEALGAHKTHPNRKKQP